jgi:hypothetical protein
MIMDLIYYCCFRERVKADKTEAVLSHLEQLAEHGKEWILKKLNYVKKQRSRNPCC